jgi:hypothetical protein
MKNTSIFQGIVELDGYRYDRQSATVHQYRDGAWVCVGQLVRGRRETNESLYRRMRDLAVEATY